MRGEAYENIFTAHYRRVLQLAEAFVAAVTDNDRESPVRCHELARAVVRALGHTGHVVDGHFGIVEHSWISLDHHTILDVYTPGSAPMVQLVHFYPLLPSYRIYKPGSPRTDIDRERVNSLLSQMLEQPVDKLRFRDATGCGDCR